MPTKPPGSPQLPALDAALFDGAEPGDDPKGPANIALAQLLAKLGGEEKGQVTVNRFERINGVRTKVLLFECTPAEFNIADLQAEYGPGEYNILVHGPLEDDPTQYGLRANKRIHIGKSRDQMKTPASDAAAAPDSALVTFMRQQSEATQRTLELIAAQLNNRSGDRGAMLAEFKTMAELFGARQGAPLAGVVTDPGTQGLNIAREVLKLAEKQIGEGEGGQGGESADGIIGRGLNILQQFLDMQKASQQQRGPAASPALTSGDGQRPPPIEGTATHDDGADEMKMAFALLLRAAANESDPESYVAMVYENAPDEVLAQMQTAEWFAMLCAAEPRCALFQPWFTKLRDAVLEQMKPEPDPAP